MKHKRFTAEDKSRIRWEAEGGRKGIQDICREQNIPEVSFPRWKRQLGHMEINEARRLKELERENRELNQRVIAVYAWFSGSIRGSDWEFGPRERATMPV